MSATKAQVADTLATQVHPAPVPVDARLHGRARARTRRRIGVPRVLIHLLVLGAIVVVVAGRGYWDVSGNAGLAAAADQVGDLRRVPVPGQLTMPSADALLGGAAVTIAAPGSDVRTGYVSELASAVVSGQLQLQTVSATEGSTIAEIADESGRSINTLLWANGMSDPVKPLQPGTQVRVPPVNGMLHVVHDGDTLESIAARYDVEVEAITGYAGNNVQTSADLVPYRLLMVPGGTMPTRDRVITYTVRDGDSLAWIAQFFGLSPSTLVWANSLQGDLIFPGQHLAILPVDGVMVTVQDGDSVESLAAHYGVDPGAIRDYAQNGLGVGGQLRVGQQVMIPGGEPPPPPPPPPAPEPAPAPAAPAPAAPAPAAAPPPPPPPSQPSGRFIWPAAGSITQYFGPSDFWMEPAYAGYAHFHLGLDIANGFGTPISAADAGTVIFAGWNTAGLGYAVAIDHGNGLVTWYGHMNAQPAVWVGQYVGQGEYLGPMGSTGASTGSHTHFVVIKNGIYVDPLDYLR